MTKEELEKENAELKKEYSDNLSLKDEELMCLEEAKELLARWVSDKPCTVSEQKDLISDTEQFLSEVGK